MSTQINPLAPIFTKIISHYLSHFFANFGPSHIQKISTSLRSTSNTLELSKLKFKEHVMEDIFKEIDILHTLLMKASKHQIGESKKNDKFFSFANQLLGDSTSNLAFRIKSGLLEQLTICIPWQLQKKSVTIKVKGVCLLLVPTNENEIRDIEAQNKRSMQWKRLNLDRWEEKWSRGLENTKEKKSSFSLLKTKKSLDNLDMSEGQTQLEGNFFDRLMETILNNIHIEIEDFHIRYEDERIEDNPFILGTYFRNLKVTTTDENFNPQFTREIHDITYRCVDCNDFSIYLNHPLSNLSNNDLNSQNLISKEIDIHFLSRNQVFFSGGIFSTPNQKKIPFDSDQLFINEMKRLVDSPYNDYIIFPSVAQLRLKMQKLTKKLLKQKKPQFDADIEFFGIQSSLSEQQYRTLTRFADYITNFSTFGQFRRYKPITTINENPQNWWKFALKCIKIENRRRHIYWSQITEFNLNRKRYVELYKKKQEVPWHPKLNEEEKRELDELETIVSLNNLTFFRKLALVEINEEQKQHSEWRKQQIKPKNLFSDKNTFLKKLLVTTPDPGVIQITEESRQALYQCIGYTEDDENRLLQETDDSYIRLQSKIKMNEAIVLLYEQGTKERKRMNLLKANFTGLFIELKATSKSFLTNVNALSFELIDCQATHSCYQYVIRRRDTTSKTNLISLSFIKNPKAINLKNRSNLILKADYSLALSLDHVYVIINIDFIRRLLSFLNVDQVNYQKLEEFAREKIEKVTSVAKDELKKMLEKKVSFDLDINVKSPLFIFPTNCRFQDSKSMVLDLGLFTAKSKLSPIRDNDDENFLIQVNNEELKDSYELNLENVCIFSPIISTEEVINFTERNDKIQLYSNSEHIMKKVDFHIKISQSLVPSNESIPRLEITSSVDNIKSNISPQVLKVGVQLADSFTDFIENPTGSSDSDLKLRAVLLVNGPVTNLQWIKAKVEVRSTRKILLYDISSDKLIGTIKLKANTNVKGSRSKERVFRIDSTFNQNDSQLNCHFFACDSSNQCQDWIKKLRQLINSFTMSFSIGNFATSILKDLKSNISDSQIHEIVGTSSNLQTLFGVNFSLNNLILELERENGYPLIEIGLTNLKIQAIKTIYETLVTSSVSSVIVKSLLQESLHKTILEGRSGNDIANFELIFANQKSQKFSKDAALRISTSIEGMNAEIDPSLLIQILSFTKDCFSTLQYIDFKKTIYQELKKAVLRPGKCENILKVDFKTGAMGLLLNKDNRPVIEIKAPGFSSSFLLNMKRLQLNGLVENVIIMDRFSKDPVYKTIFGLGNSNSDSMVSFQFIRKIYEEENSQFKNEFFASLQQIQYIHIQRVFRNLRNYIFDELQQSTLYLLDEFEKIKDSSPIKGFPDKSLTKFNIQIANPILIIPESHLSKKHLLMNLGHISVSNSLNRDDNILEEVIQIEIQNMNAEATILNIEQKIVQNGTLSVEIRRIINNFSSKKKALIKAHVDCSELSIDISQAHFQMFFDIFNLNLRDGLESIKKEKKIFQLFEQLSQKISSYRIDDVTAPVNNFDSIDIGTPLDFDISSNTLIVDSYTIFEGSINLPIFSITLRTLESPFIDFVVSNSQAFYSQFNNGFSNGYIKIGNVKGTNTKHQTTSEFINMLKMQGMDEDPLTCFSLYYIKESSIHDFKLKFSNSSVTLIPEVLEELTSFVTNTQYIKNNNPKNNENNESSESSEILIKVENENKDEISNLSFNTPIKISADFGKTEIVLFEDYSDINSKKLVLSFSAGGNFSKNGTEENGDYSIKNLCAFISQETISFHEKESASLMFPIDIIASLNTKEINSNKSERNIIAYIEKGVSSRVSYQDIRLIVQIINQFSKKQIGDMKVFDKTIEEGMFLKMWISDNLKNSPLLLQLASKAQVHFNFVSRNPLQILIVDDITGFDIPLFSFTISKLKMEGSLMQEDSQSPSLKVQSQILTLFDVKYYNYSIAEWEPVIEETHQPISITYKHAPSKIVLDHSEDKVSIKSSDTININITHSMIATTIKTLKLWLEGLKSSKSQVSAKFEPYSIRNYTGLPVKFYFPIIQTIEDAIPITHEEFRFSFPNQETEEDLSSAITLVIQGKDKILHVNKEKNQFIKIWEKSNKILNDRYFCCVNVSVLNGRKEITIHSGVFIVNKTKTTWKLGIYLVDNSNLVDVSKIKEFGSIQPGKKFYIPLYYLSSNYCLLYKPENLEFNYMWSKIDNTKTLTNLISNENRRILFSCKSETANAHHKHFHCIQDIQIKSEKNINLTIKIKLIPPLCIENVLSSPLKIQLFKVLNNKPVQLCSLNILAGEREFIHYINLQSDIWLRPVLIGEWKANSTGLIYSVTKDLSLLETTFRNEYIPNMKQLLIQGEYSFDRKIAFQHISLYCPYWIVNHTKKFIEVKVGDEPVAGKLESYEPLIFNYPSSNVLFSNTINLKIGNMFQSDKFSIDTPGTNGNLKVTNGSAKYELGVNVEMGKGQFHRTKVVTLTPRYMLVNRTKNNIYFREFGTDHEILVQSNESEPYYGISSKHSDFPIISARTETSNWTGALKIDSNRSFNPMLWNSTNQTHEFASIQIFQQKSIIYIIFELMDTPPYIINNQSKFVLHIAQKGTSTWSILEKNDSIPFSWTEQNKSHILQIRCSQHSTYINLDNMQAEAKLKVNNEVAHIKLYTNGKERTVIITEKQYVEAPTINFNSSDDEIEKVLFQVKLKLKGLGFSLIDQKPQELAYVFVQDAIIFLLMSNMRQYLDAKAKRIQINNQLPDTLYPITFINSKKLEEEEVFFTATIARMYRVKDYHSFPFLSVYLGEFDVALDLNFMNKIANFFLTLDKNTIQNNEIIDPSIIQSDELIDNLNWLRELSTGLEKSKKTYFQLFQIYPLIFNLTLLVNQRQDHSASSRSSLISLFEAIGAQFNVNIDDSPIQVQSLTLHHQFMTTKELVERVSKHYQQQAMTEVYKAIGSFDFLGNPFGLFHDFDSGVYDLIYEPLEALRRDPRDITKGIARGSVSFFKHSIHGTFNSASKVTESIGNGLSYLSLDSQYISERHKQHRKENPRHVGEGLVFGFQSLGYGVFDGITGIVTKPIEGASDGITGFVSGVGKGIVGVPIKPVTALLDFASKTTRGIRNTTTYFEKEHRERTRLPRVFGIDGKLIAFDATSSETQYILHQLRNGIYSSDIYECHVALQELTSVLILSNKRLVYVLKSSNIEEWMIPLEEVEDIQINSNNLKYNQVEIIVNFNELGKKNNIGGWFSRSLVCQRTGPFHSRSEDEANAIQFIQKFNLLRVSSETHDLE